ncbi:hypothetical protein F4777DRAFT_89201 [Nemania sp. FL0916]|nr:hypothetical protein F4777DRAFT_89201 [Nemania sp. FL0916]
MSTAQCYYPNGKEAPKSQQQPCNSTEDGRVSLCCDMRNSVCTTTGLCLGSAGYYYRGTCTDRSWISPSCPRVCTDQNKDSTVNFYPCVAGNFDFKHQICCGYSDTKDCCANNFTTSFGIPFAPTHSVAAAVSLIATTVTQSESVASNFPISTTECVAPTQTPACTSCGPPPIAGYVGGTVGAGVGVGLIGLIVILLRERKWRKETTKKSEATTDFQWHQPHPEPQRSYFAPAAELDVPAGQHDKPPSPTNRPMFVIQ